MNVLANYIITDNRYLKRAKIRISPNNRSVRFIPVINDFTNTFTSERV